MILKASIDNSKITTISSSIKLAIESAIPYYSFTFKVIVIIVCKALESNQCPWDLLNTQAFTTIKNKINNDLRNIPSKGGGTWPLILAHV
jgi:membrane-associated PAP2 superfamily phosphatase